MEAHEGVIAIVKSGTCPFFRAARVEPSYPVSGYCEAASGGLMIPSIEEYRKWCSTAAHTACPLHQSQRAQRSRGGRAA